MRKGMWTLVFIGLALSLVIAGLLSFYADPNEDGLERVAVDYGFADDAVDSANAQIFTSDYLIAGVENERLSTLMAGTLGVAVMIGAAFGLFWLLTRGKDRASVEQ